MQSTAARELFDRVRGLGATAAISGAAASAGAEVYAVGGTVRDLLLGHTPLDIDLAIDGELGELAAALGSGGEAPTRFGTLSLTRDGLRYDLARTRTERYSHPGALPDVMPAPIDADLSRRDFTVNALALGLAGPRTGELIAPDGALADLHAGRLAVLHEQSFRDDPTRLMRLARYSVRLAFKAAPQTLALARAAVRSGALETISSARAGNELRLLAAEPDPAATFAAVADLGLPWRLDPALTATALAALPPDGRRDLLVLACVFAAAAAPAAGTKRSQALSAELGRLGFTAADRDRIVAAATTAERLARSLREAATPAAIARAVDGNPPEAVALAAAHGAPAQARAWFEDLRHRRLQITGHDLLAAGLAEGPQIGLALRAARDALMDGSAPGRDAQLVVALQAAR